ncbi:MAG: DUF4149 domain-containing protein [Sphingomonadales bacterium]|nr:DUF4149 domain-containing protein [Sphingomonadales bacterium]
MTLELVLTVISLVWAGAVLGVSFIATPIKFRAPMLDRPTAFDVGRVTFLFFEKVEWALAILLILLILGAGPQSVPVVYGLIVVVIVALQVLWLTPKLVRRAVMLSSGEVPPESSAHRIFVILEAIKLICLILFGGHMATEL